LDPRIVASAGLLLDIVGAVVMASGLIRLRDPAIRSAGHLPGASLGGASPNKALMEILRSSRREARIGAALLVMGFVVQLVAQWL
jgi:hypothetical protein